MLSMGTNQSTHRLLAKYGSRQIWQRRATSWLSKLSESESILRQRLTRGIMVSNVWLPVSQNGPCGYICLTPVPLCSKGGNGLDGQFVVDFLRTHVPEEEVLEDPDGVWKVATMRTKAGMQTCRRCEPFAEAPYILVMDRADMSLAQVLLSHRLIVHTQ